MCCFWIQERTEASINHVAIVLLLYFIHYKMSSLETMQCGRLWCLIQHSVSPHIVFFPESIVGGKGKSKPRVNVCSNDKPWQRWSNVIKMPPGGWRVPPGNGTISRAQGWLIFAFGGWALSSDCSQMNSGEQKLLLLSLYIIFISPTTLCMNHLSKRRACWRKRLSNSHKKCHVGDSTAQVPLLGAFIWDQKIAFVAVVVCSERTIHHWANSLNFWVPWIGPSQPLRKLYPMPSSIVSFVSKQSDLGWETNQVKEEDRKANLRRCTNRQRKGSLCRLG